MDLAEALAAGMFLALIVALMSGYPWPSAWAGWRCSSLCWASASV